MGVPLKQVTLELPNEEIALQAWLVMQQGGLVVPVQDVAFDAQLDVELAFGFCPHRYVLKGKVVSATPHGTALQLEEMPIGVRAFFTALEQGDVLPDPPLPTTRTGRISTKLKGDFWSTLDEFPEVMLGGDTDDELETSAGSSDESQSVICEIHDSSSLELPPELAASMEFSSPVAATTAETAETEEAVFETLAQTLLGLDPDELDETSGELDAEIDAMLEEVQREDPFTDRAEPSMECGEDWSAVPWTCKADRRGKVSREGTGSLIKELTASRDTGVLRMDLPDRTVYSLWLAGNPTFVTADPPEEGGELEHALASFPLVDPTVFEQALKKSAEQDRHLALVLIDVGILQAEDVRDLMRLMARRAVRMCPMLNRGHYQFWECAVPMGSDGLELDLESVLAWEPGVSPPSEDSLI